jgi:hypothetical protein
MAADGEIRARQHRLRALPRRVDRERSLQHRDRLVVSTLPQEM